VLLDGREPFCIHALKGPLLGPVLVQVVAFPGLLLEGQCAAVPLKARALPSGGGGGTHMCLPSFASKKNFSDCPYFHGLKTSKKKNFFIAHTLHRIEAAPGVDFPDIDLTEL
jgi:hypothetical protein